jgi:PAS domain S-box-containing protein
MLPRGYELLEPLGPTGGSTLCRARRQSDQAQVLLKVLADESLRPEQHARLRREYELLATLDLPGVLRPVELVAEGRSHAIVIEDRRGERLEIGLAAGALPLPCALRLARELAHALADLHEAQLVHRDLRPANLLADIAAGNVYLADLSRTASRTASGNEVGGDSSGGDLAYVAPEQTGRMHQPIDHRTDLYSLGVVVYQMISGALPFAAKDPLEWVHCHLARSPAPLHEVVPGLPRVVSDIVAKLLAKPPEARYQSAHGVEVDLERCLASCQAGAPIEPFPLAAEDRADRVRVPSRLYGRARELEALLAVYRRVAASGDAELVLVAGSSGIGKSALVHELQAPIAKDGGLFVAGKFDQYTRDIPHATIAHAFRRLVQQVLAGGEAEVEDSRRRLRHALGSNAQVIAAILPELELVIGKPAPVPAVGALEAQNRFHATFRRFLGVFTRPQRPILLFLDDLQWADSASLALLDELLLRPVPHLLVIGAYRDADVTPAHPLAPVLERVRTAGIRTLDVALGPLGPEQLGRLVADTFLCSGEAAAPLARLLHAKTGGEPFFAIQFLTTLQQDGLIALDPAVAGWRWDVDRIAARDYTDNVVELMLDKLRRLPEATRALMTLAACIGTRFEASTLALICGRGIDAVDETLRMAVHEGLILRTDGYRFLHDRIRQATYSLTPEEHRAGLHARLGRILLAHASPEQRAEGPFEIAVHFVIGASCVVDRDEKAEIAQLLLACGRRAKASAAHQAAAVLLATATGLLPDRSWEDRHDLTYRLHLERADCAWLIGQFEEAAQLLATLLARARTTIERLAVHAIQVKLHTIRGELALSIDSGVRALGLIGFAISAHPSVEQVDHAYRAVWALLEDRWPERSIEHLLALPPATDPEMKAGLDLASSMLDVASFTDANLVQLLTCFMVETTIRHGVTDSSAVGCAGWAMFLLDRGRPAEAFQFGKLACDLVAQPGASVQRARVATYVEGTLNPWIRPYGRGLAPLAEATQTGIENGDLLWATYSHAILGWLRFLAGQPLPDVDREAESHLELLRATRSTAVPTDYVGLRRCIARLRGLPGDDLDEAAYEDGLNREARPVVVATHYIWTMIAHVVFGEHEAALVASTKAEAKLWGLYRLTTRAEFRTYDALTRAALYPDATPEQQASYMTALVEHEAALRAWAEDCPENFAAKQALVAAEIARIERRDADAERGYEAAIHLARAGGLVPIEAIANDIASRFYRERGVASVAAMYLREAHACYACWGADGKVAQLERQHPSLLAPRIRPQGARDADPTPAIRAEQLDLLTVVKASQAISCEIVLDDLLQTLMRVVLESAGAQSASLLLVRGSEPVRAAVASVDPLGVSVGGGDGEPLLPGDLPLSVLHYVRRTREQVLLGDARQPNPFASDEYIARHRPVSILCLPILRQAELVGLLYLENDLVTDAFTPDRLAVLELLAAQAAISLENARLYADLRRENREREQAEAALRESRALLQAVIDNTAASIYVKDLEGRFLLVNRCLAETVRWDRAALIGKTDYDLFPREQADAVRIVDAHVLAAGIPLEAEESVPLEGGELHTYLSIKAPLTDRDGRIVGLCGISTDITERKRAEASLRRSEDQLRQAQKMEAIGNLAGGIAHDFNNLLSVILGYSSMLAQQLPSGDPRRADIEEIAAAGQRASELTRQLLAFARKQILQPKVVSLNDVLTGIERMLRRLIGEDVELTVATDPGLGTAMVDPGQIEQIIMNLAVNSRDAMPQGGKLTLETRNVVLDESYAAEHTGAAIGPHVMLAVTDTGVGMDEATRARMFEPFFTTKERGKGTGLGLATVFGIVKQSGGTIWVYSEPGKGTSFKIYLPRTDATAPGPSDIAVPSRPRGGHETILIVEDEPRVRTLVRTILERFGYHVLEAQSGSDALVIGEKYDAAIHLLLTDVVMPRISGRQLTDQLRPLRPEMKVLYMSGYTDDSIVHHGILDPGLAFLQKPVTPEALMQKVREVLDAT